MYLENYIFTSEAETYLSNNIIQDNNMRQAQPV